MAYLFSPWRILAECATPAPWAVVVGQPEAEAFVTDGVIDLLRVMGDAELTPDQRAAAFASAVCRLTDLDHVAARILGEDAGRLTSAQRRGFAAAFGAHVVRAYDGRPWRGDVEDLALLGSSNPRPDEVVVSFMIPDDRAFAPIQMSWRVLRSTGGWRLIDVECRGVWLIGAPRPKT